MSTKETSVTTETAPDGTETVAEINTTIFETAPDGTETVAEITTTQGDDPSTIEGHLTITETAPDGTETVVEITTTAGADDSLTADDGDSLIEKVVEAVFDVEIGDDANDAGLSAEGTTGHAEFDIAESDSPLETSTADFTAGDVTFAPNDLPADLAATPVMAAPFDSSLGTADTAFSATTPPDTSFDSSLGTTDAETSAQDAHAQAATEAQQTADEFIASGDYAAAAEAREVAENEAWEAGDQSMLSAYDSSDLAVAAEKQEEAEHYSGQQAMYAQQGDYEAAREAADNAAYATYEADSGAGGDDHTGQADAEKYNMDWAVHEEKQADYYAENAAAYAADGDFENAERSASSAAAHQESADHFGDLGEHGGDVAVFDPSSVVATGGTYESSLDSSATQVDTGFDSGMDTSMNSVADPGTDDI